MDNLIGKIVIWNNKNMNKQYIGIVKSISFPNQTALIYGCGSQMPPRFLAPIKELEVYKC